ncbi:MAG TPA: DnaA/Hda family protein, partial [Alphaproteobacteria bacterium]|nr:DnaA/Hda family protein [Alphaproteobacteria bacterium]
MKAQAVLLSHDDQHTEQVLEPQAAWQQLRTMLRERFGETAFRRWLEPVTGSVETEAEGGPALTLSLPTRFMRDWVEAHYGDTIRTLWRQVAHGLRVDFLVVSPLNKAPEAKEIAPEIATPVAAPLINEDMGTTQLGSLPSITAPDLDPRFTFENFVVGKSNELAYAAARRVADTETPTFNPLFLYGGVGLGKTHLMHAIAWHIRKNYPNRRVIYMSAEKFMYQFVRALRYKDTVAFKDQFRSVDVLMIDDVQFIGGKDTTQEEFFHT